MKAMDDAPDIITFGCRLNSFESEVMRAHAADAGLGGALVFNTCAVTGEAERQARQAIRKARREHPHRKIIVTGCAAQTNPQAFAAMPEVDLILGNAEKMQKAPWAQTPAQPRVQVGDIMAEHTVRPPLIQSLTGRTRAFVQVQNGCDHRCTFCIIPFGRGNSRSVPSNDVVAQVRRLVENGHAEVVLAGVDMTSWGADLAGTPRLGNLVRTILSQVPELKRLRLSSIDSIEADETLIAAFAEEERLMPHVHLSLQAGDNMILKRMKRRHAREDAIALCARLQRLRPGLAIGADIIAGFPTETEEMFAQSLDLIDSCGLTFLHVFPFSARPGTPAARMPQVPGDVTRERSARLRAHGTVVLQQFLQNQIGKMRNILVEETFRGRTEHFAPVQFVQARVPGTIVSAPIVAAAATCLKVEIAP